MSIEQQFLDVVNSVFEQFRAKEAEARKILDEMKALSEEHGVPFDSSVSFVHNTYTPKSFREKFPGFDFEVFEEICTELDPYEFKPDGYHGWEKSSSVGSCY